MSAVIAACVHVTHLAVWERVLEWANTDVRLQDVIPYLVRHQRTAPPLPLAKADSAALVQSALVGGGAAGLPDYATSLSHGDGGGGTRSASAYSGASLPPSMTQLPTRHCRRPADLFAVAKCTVRLLLQTLNSSRSCSCHHDIRCWSVMPLWHRHTCITS